jgi:hypothetical protein
MKKENHAVTPITERFTLRLIEMALRKLHTQLTNGDDFKASPSDLIRLIEAHQTMQQAKQPNEVLVRWIDKPQTAPTD